MKYAIKTIITCFALLLLNACNVTDPPIIVASRFAEAVAQGDVKKAKSYCTTKTSVYLDILYTVNGVKPNKSFNVMFTKESIHGERAFVYYRRNYNEDDSNYLTLVLEGEVWKVDLSTRDVRSYSKSKTPEKANITQVSSSATHTSQTSQAKEVNEEAYSEVEEETSSDNDITESFSSIPSSTAQSSPTQSSSPTHMMVDGKYYDLKGDKSAYSKNRYDYDEDKNKRV